MKTTYYINKDKGSVTCKLEFDINTNLFDRYDLVAIGVSKCSPLDEFDEVYGKRLANLRAHIRYHQVIKEHALNLGKLYYDRFIKCSDLYTRSDSIVDSLKAKVKSIEVM